MADAMADGQNPVVVLAGLLRAHPVLNNYLSAPDASATVEPVPLSERTDLLQATVVWRHGEPLLRGRRYRLRIGAETVMATVAPLRYRVNLESGERVAATMLERDQVGVCDLELSAAVSFAPYHRDPGQGTFVLIDPRSGRRLAAGAVRYGLRRADNLPGQTLTVDRRARAQRTGQTPCVLWFTGRPGAGKSTIANRVEAELHARGRHTYLLDGDNVRRGLNRDLGFTDADRVENIRRVAEVTRLMLDAGLIVLVSFISPFRAERRMARSLFAEHEFLEIFIDTPLAVAEARDPKGLYAKARRGELRNFTGIDSAYEPPESPELRIATVDVSADTAAAGVIALIENRGLLPRP
jgi:bifunctional enzyme CysN/CysC